MSTQSHYWFVPRRSLFVPRGVSKPNFPVLRRADSPMVSGIDQVVENGHPFSIVVRSVHVAENFDDADDSYNDLLVRSWVRYGSEPEIELIHCFQSDVPPLAVLHDTIVSPHVLARPQHQVDKRVWVNVQVLDVDSRKLKRMAQVLRSERIEAIAHTTGAIFPGTLPFLHGVLDDAMPLFRSLRELLGNKDDVILDQSLDFLSQDSGETPFRYGAYVFFQDELDGSHYRLNQFALEWGSGDRPVAEIHPIPGYVVLEIIPAVVQSIGDEQNNILMQQQLAAGLRFPENDEVSGMLTKRFEYLQSVFKKATQLDELLDYQRLQHLHQKGVELNGFESKRLLDLDNRLSEYGELLDEILD